MEIGLLYSIIAGLLSIIIALIGWSGNRVVNRIDDLRDRIDGMAEDTNTRLSRHDYRITKAEVQIDMLSIK